MPATDRRNWTSLGMYWRYVGKKWVNKLAEKRCFSLCSISRLERQRYGGRRVAAFILAFFARGGNALKLFAYETKTFSLYAENKVAAKADSSAWNTAVRGAGSDCIATKLFR